MSTWKSLVMVCALLLSGCSSIQGLRDLDVSLVKIEPIQPVGLSPRFNVHLLVSNPNAEDLNIEGISLQLNVADQKVLSGVSNQIPELKAYGETAIEIQTSVNLFYIFKLLTALNQQSDKGIKYQLKTTIDPEGFVPFNVSKEGILDEDILQGLSSLTK
ncbi:MAG: LEA type 2 family protein [Moritella sp.]|uniref:LEA type 2 family protein n=1 Tax=Moritella sp. TaxID=78556 RepID=UPI0029B5823E|nr:LEA type 2 family protein [Moritella sp.]MDX2319959.1 LEA type 2 family protein [Moritella sp.]